MLSVEECEDPQTNCHTRTAKEIFADHTTYTFNPDHPTPADLPQKLYSLIKYAPTSMNTHPMRLIVVPQEKKPGFVEYMSEKNRPKTLDAPLTLIVAVDADFHETLNNNIPGGAESLHAMFAGNAPEERAAWAETQVWIQLGYLIVAARSLGYGVGPMTGFDRKRVNAELLPQNLRALAVVNIGHEGENPHRPRKPRLDPETVITTL